jgi:hypothetical protein
VKNQKALPAIFRLEVKNLKFFFRTEAFRLQIIEAVLAFVLLALGILLIPVLGWFFTGQ